MIEYIRVPVTIHAQVFVPKDDLEIAVAEFYCIAIEPTTKYEEVLERLAREQVPDGDNFKIREIFVDITNAQ